MYFLFFWFFYSREFGREITKEKKEKKRKEGEKTINVFLSLSPSHSLCALSLWSRRKPFQHLRCLLGGNPRLLLRQGNRTRGTSLSLASSASSISSSATLRTLSWLLRNPRTFQIRSLPLQPPPLPPLRTPFPSPIRRLQAPFRSTPMAPPQLLRTTKVGRMVRPMRRRTRPSRTWFRPVLMLQGASPRRLRSFPSPCRWNVSNSRLEWYISYSTSSSFLYFFCVVNINVRLLVLVHMLDCDGCLKFYALANFYVVVYHWSLW